MTCGECTKAGRCVDQPTPNEPATVEHLDCWSCKGRGCADCGMSGKLTLRCCPCTLIDTTTQHAMRMAKFAKDRDWPDPGTWMDQLEINVHTAELIWAEQARCHNDQVPTE